jgi:hypothetical protein
LQHLAFTNSGLGGLLDPDLLGVAELVVVVTRPDERRLDEVGTCWGG